LIFYYLFPDFLIDIFEGPAPKPPSLEKQEIMLSSRRRKVRPLGLVVPESRLEIQVEKAMFKTNIQILNQIVSKQRRPPRYVHPNSPEPMSHAQNRYLLTTDSEFQKMNNATSSVFHKKIIDRVMSAQAERRESASNFRRPSSVCPRHEANDDKYARIRNSHCDVLGPYFCTDCIQLRKRSKSAHQQRQNFPRIEVHTRSLIAPERLEKLLINHNPTTLEPFSYNNSFGGEDLWDINGHAIYSVNDVHWRLRELHKEKGKHVFGENKRRISKSAGLIPKSVFVRNKPADVQEKETKPTVHFAIPGSHLTTTMTSIRIPTNVS